MRDEQLVNGKCGNCGQSDFEWGWLHQTGVNAGLMFAGNDVDFNLLGLAGVGTNVRRCRNCNHLELFAAEDE
jgi:hypothetical protein